MENAVRVCKFCGTTKPLAEFGADSAKRDGFNIYCRACVKAKSREQRRRHADRCKAYDKARNKLPEVRKRKREARVKHDQKRAGSPRFKATKRAIQKRQRERYPERYGARLFLNAAVLLGFVTRGPCAQCGKTPTDGHHHDYSKPLDVTWLCRSCHMRLHGAEWRELAMKQ